MALVEPNQLKELVLGLDLLNKPFLWVVCPCNVYPDEFHESKGKIVGWTPEKKELDLPSIACFICRYGWNSTMEGVCLSCVWKIGMGLDKDENGLI